MESHWESHGLNPKIQKYAARFFTTNSPKKLKSKNPKYPKSQKTKFGELPKSQKNKLWKCAPSSSWGNSEHISKLLFVAGLAPNIVHRTRTSVQAEHVHRTCSGGGGLNKRSDQSSSGRTNTNSTKSMIRTNVQTTRTRSAEHVQIRTPNKTPNTNKRFPNTEHCSDPALACCTESTKLKKSNAKKKQRAPGSVSSTE